MLIKNFLIKYLTPLIWKKFPSRQTQTLQEFSQVEFDSGHQGLKCLQQTKNLKLKGYLFQHILEEYNHSDLFSARARDRADKHLTIKVLPQRQLLPKNPSEQDIVKCFSYIHTGEKSVNKEFLAYLNSEIDEKTKNIFRRITMDESKHEVDTLNFLEQISNEQNLSLNCLLVRSHCKKLWYSYNDTLRKFGRIPLILLLSVVYFLLGWISVRQLKKRLTADRSIQFKIFKTQIKRFESQATK